MSGRFLAFIFLLMITLIPGLRLAAQDHASRPTLCVAPFTGDQATVPGWRPEMGQGLSEMLVESLENSDNTFQFVETAEGAEAAAPSGSTPAKKSSAGDATDAKSPAPPAADFTFYAEVTQFLTKTNSSRIGDFLSSSHFGNLGGSLMSAHIEIAWRIMDTAAHKVVKRGITIGSGTGTQFDMAAAPGTSTTVAAAAATKVPVLTNAPAVTNKTMAMMNSFFGGLGHAFGGSSSGTSNGSGNGTSARSPTPATPAPAPKPAAGTSESSGQMAAGDSATYGYANPEFMESALGKASVKAITNILAQLAVYQLPPPERLTVLQNTPGKILAVVNNDTIIVSLGSNQGFKSGDHLKIYQKTDVKDDQGNVVFTDEKVVGELVLSEVQDAKSRGAYSGDVKLQQGWTVKAN